MKIPITWLKDYVETDKKPAEIAKVFTSLGLMLDKPIDGDVLDLEHRMDRADWLSVIGCARDFAAFEGLKLHEQKVYGKPGKSVVAKKRITITGKTTAAHRFNTRVFRGVKIGPSPKWLVDRLEAYGMESKNNIVDITNYTMVEYGQPLHAQDIAKLPAPEITLRKATSGETITTLLGTTVVLDRETDILASGGKPVVIMGIVGGAETGVTETTVDILLDAGNYDARVIRKTSRRLRIMNETVSRCDKFLDPRLTEVALARATELILEIAGGTYYENEDWYPHPKLPQSEVLHFARLAQLSGMDIPIAQVKRTLRALEYQIIEESDDALTVEVPYFRTDIEVEDDLVADILRIGDYTNIPATPLASPVPVDITSALYRFEDRLRDVCAAMGCDEHITDPLVKATGRVGEIHLANSLSEDQNALRTSLVPGLVHVQNTYKKHGIATPVFELGSVYDGTASTQSETRQLTVVGSDPSGYLATILSALGIKNYSLSSHEADPVLVLVNLKLVGTISTSSFTLNTAALIEHVSPYQSLKTEIAHVPSLDISLTLPTGTHFEKAAKILAKSAPKPSSIAVIERYENSLLVRLTWDKQIDADKVRLSLVKALEAAGIATRSK